MSASLKDLVDTVPKTTSLCVILATLKTKSALLAVFWFLSCVGVGKKQDTMFLAINLKLSVAHSNVASNCLVEFTFVIEFVIVTSAKNKMNKLALQHHLVIKYGFYFFLFLFYYLLLLFFFFFYLFKFYRLLFIFILFYFILFYLNFLLFYFFFFIILLFFFSGLPLENCEHRCVQGCHPNTLCSVGVCNQTSIIYCECKRKKISVTCGLGHDQEKNEKILEQRVSILKCDKECEEELHKNTMALVKLNLFFFLNFFIFLIIFIILFF